MDRYKFRVWDFNLKKMFIVNAIYFQNELKDSVYSVILNRKIDPVLGTGFEEFNLMQFTGLIDKNGKEIYEGDILKSGKRNFEVIFSHASFMMSYANGASVQFINEMVEIIGNIYENPNGI